MNSTNLASLIAPNVLYKKSAGAILSDSMAGNVVLDLIINNHASLFKHIPKQSVLAHDEPIQQLPSQSVEKPDEKPKTPRVELEKGQTPRTDESTTEHTVEEHLDEEAEKADHAEEGEATKKESTSEPPSGEKRKRITKKKSLRKTKREVTKDGSRDSTPRELTSEKQKTRPRSGSKSKPMRSSKDNDVSDSKKGKSKRKQKKEEEDEEAEDAELQVEVEYHPPPCEWQAFLDPQSGSYYYHYMSKEKEKEKEDVTVWECPEEFSGMSSTPSFFLTRENGLTHSNYSKMLVTTTRQLIPLTGSFLRKRPLVSLTILIPQPTQLNGLCLLSSEVGIENTKTPSRQHHEISTMW